MLSSSDPFFFFFFFNVVGLFFLIIYLLARNREIEREGETRKETDRYRPALVIHAPDK